MKWTPVESSVFWAAGYAEDNSLLYLVFRSGESDMHHTRATSENLAALLPASTLVEPPWGDTEWIDRSTPEARAEGLFARWPLLAPTLLEWADRELA